MERKCPICTTAYDDGGDAWKRICYPCYQNMNFLHGMRGYEKPSRIKSYGYKCNIYLSHPSVTKDEMDNWIKEKGFERGWGAEEWSPDKWGKYKIWIDNVNFD
jgi:hypothetical protein